VARPPARRPRLPLIQIQIQIQTLAPTSSH
jgi:hypothetical protein